MDVYISGVGAPVTAAVKSQVQSLMDVGRELNVDVLVCDPSEVEVTLCIMLTPQAGYDFATVAAEVHTAVCGYINALGIGEDVKLSKVSEVIYHIKGIEDFRFVESYGSDRIVSDSSYAAAGTILVRERS